MHIKSLVIDGFKSYGKRVELKDFDPEFNAITGLNGTGKSNILDAICFTLGISAMNTIRASSMQEVIYKSGQSGVTSATVTIHFDNRDKSRSAPHYSHNDEIVISREVGMGSKNTYRINGVTVTAKKIMDFFNSLQMNVNNPHFIIMQGRITKVLNMKPIEILSMIEEAAGTNMYESKKKSLEMTVGKKDTKLKEMREVADEEIVPTMETIDKEKQMLDELNMVHSQLRKQKEKLDSWNYVKLNISVKKKSEDLQSLKDRQQDKSNFITVTEEQIKEMKLKITQNEEVLKKECEKKLSEFAVEVEKALTVKKAKEFKVNTHKTNIKSEEKNISDLEKNIKNSKKDLERKKKEMEDFNQINAGFDEENKKNTKDLDEIDKKIRLLNTGNIFGDDDGSVQENIEKFRLELQGQQTENQQNGIKLDGLKKKLNDHLTGMKESQKVYDKQMAQLATKEKEFEKIMDEYKKTKEELSNYENLRSNRDSLLAEMRHFSLKLESFESNYSSLFFRYNDPRPNFDRRKVHGLICRLVKPIDFKFELALTTLAGGRLYFVVVEDDSVGKDILDTNRFPNRVNFIPLSKIKSESLPQNIIRIAQQIGGADQVFPAMSLISYDKKHLKAVQWVFGQAFICTTKEVAEKVCFDSRVNKQCFTLEGDHFNPAGSLTGGSNTQKLVMKLVSNHNEIASQLEENKLELSSIDKKLTVMANLSTKVAELQDRQIVVQDQLERVKSDVHLGQPHQQITEVNNIKQQISELENILAEGKLNEKQLLAKIKDLETKMKNAKTISKQQLNDAENTRVNILTKIKNNKREYDEKKNNYNKLELGIKDIIAHVEEEENQLANLKAVTQNLEKDLIELVSDLDKANINYEIANKDYKSQNETVMKKTSEIDESNNNIKLLYSEIEIKRIELLEIEANMNKCLQTFEEIQNTFDDLDKRLSNEQKQMASKTDFTHFKAGKITYFK